MSSLLKTSGASYFVHKEILHQVATQSPSDQKLNQRLNQPENQDEVEEAGNQLLLLRLKVTEHLTAIKECFMFYATEKIGTDGFYPKNLRFTTASAEKLLNSANVPSKTFSLAMGTSLLSSVLLLSTRQRSSSKRKNNVLPLAASNGVSFSLFVVWLIHLSQLRYHRYDISPADKLHKLIVNNIELALTLIPEDKNIKVTSCKTWLPMELISDKVKEKWSSLALDSD
jgi:hypothetical protein